MKLGSRPIAYDPRDDQFTEIAFGAATLPVFPKTLGRIRRKVKDQGNSLSCTAQATTLASEYQENRELSAAWHWMQTCKKLNSYVPNGADPRTAMKISVELGDLPQEVAPFTFPWDDAQKIGNWNAWPFFPLASYEIHRKAAYIKIPKVGDWFDSVKTALLRGKEKNQVVMAFTRWFAEWGGAEIPTTYSNFSGYHAHTWIDFDTDEQGEFIWGQNSYPGVGDSGFQKWRRETVNKELSQWGCGAYIFEDLTADQIARAKEDSIAGQIQRAIIGIWWKIQELYGRI